LGEKENLERKRAGISGVEHAQESCVFLQRITCSGKTTKQAILVILNNFHRRVSDGEAVLTYIFALSEKRCKAGSRMSKCYQLLAILITILLQKADLRKVLQQMESMHKLLIS
jgi:hypothetical protein